MFTNEYDVFTVGDMIAILLRFCEDDEIEFEGDYGCALELDFELLEHTASPTFRFKRKEI